MLPLTRVQTTLRTSHAIFICLFIAVPGYLYLAQRFLLISLFLDMLPLLLGTWATVLSIHVVCLLRPFIRLLSPHELF